MTGKIVHELREKPDDAEKRYSERSYYLPVRRAVEFDTRSMAPANRMRYSEVAARILSLRSTGTMLDIGCGTARMLVEIARTTPSLQIVGIDLSEPMIEIGRKNISGAGLSARISLRSGSAEELGVFPDASFDLVMSSACLSAWLDPVETLLQVHRITKDAGSVLLCDWNRKASIISRSRLLLDALNDVTLRRRIRMAFSAAYSPGELKKIVSATPFEVLELRTESHWMLCTCRKAVRNDDAGPITTRHLTEK